MATAQAAQSQQVRGDQTLLELVGQLRSRGTWKPDVQGIQSASRQAFAQETYRVLMPTVFDRFVVSNCTNYKFRYCTGPSAGPGVIGNSQSFTTVGLPPTTQVGIPSTPCIYHANAGTYYCRYPANAPPAALMKRIWGPVSAVCDYQPPNLNTLWTYGCSLGVPAAASVRANAPGWTFTTHAGHPVTTSSAVGAAGATAGTVRAHRRGRRLGRARRAAPSGCRSQGGARGPRSAAVHRPGRARARTAPAPDARRGRADLVRAWSPRGARPLALRAPVAAVHAQPRARRLLRVSAARRAPGAPPPAAARRARRRPARPAPHRDPHARHPRAVHGPAGRRRAVPAARSSSRRACACATADSPSGSRPAKPGAACATANTSSPRSGR